MYIYHSGCICPVKQCCNGCPFPCCMPQLPKGGLKTCQALLVAPHSDVTWFILGTRHSHT